MPATVEPLVCPRCGAPLPADLVATPRCGYCGVGVMLRGGAIETTAGASGAHAQGQVDRQAFTEAVTAAVKRGDPPADAIRQAAAAHLGVLGESNVIGRLTLAIARDFDRQNPGAGIEHDGIALTRIAEGYVKALPYLRESGEGPMNLPFLGVTPGGPVHFDMILTPASIAKLLAQRPHEERPLAAAPPVATPTPELELPVPEPPKKRGWWPFGG